MKEAIVIGCNVNGLGVIRSLGLKNFRITALYYDRLDFAHASKYVFEKIIIPNPGAEEEKFVDFLIRKRSIDCRIQKQRQAGKAF